MKRRLLWIGLLLMALGTGGGFLACGAPVFDFQVYYGPSAAASLAPSLQKMFFVMRSTSDSRLSSWSATLNRNDRNLDGLPCPQAPPALAWGVLPGTLTTLPPYVEVLAYDTANVTAANVGGLPPPTVSGRFPLEVACQTPLSGAAGRQVSVFLAPSGALTSWRGSGPSAVPESWSQRMGHRVTRLPDGRYLISGGVQRLTIASKNDALQWTVRWHEHLAIFSPTTGRIEQVELGLRRAFHTALWRNNRLFLSGGLVPQDQGEGVALAKGVEVAVFDEATGRWSLRTPTAAELQLVGALPQRAMHQTLRVPVPGRSDAFQLAFVGGLTALPPAKPDPKDGLQVLFHSVASVPASEQSGAMVLMTGGAFRNEEDLFEASQAGFSFRITANGQLEQTTSTNKVAAVLHRPRAGHVSLALSSSLVVVLGGFRGHLGEPSYVETLEFLQRDGSSWRSAAECKLQTKGLLQRAFSSITRLHEQSDRVEMLVAGGMGVSQARAPSLLLSWKADDKLPLCQQIQVKVLDEPHHAAVHGMHSATLLETGQVMLIGGGLFHVGASTVYDAKGGAAWFNPAPSYTLLPAFGNAGRGE